MYYVFIAMTDFMTDRDTFEIQFSLIMLQLITVLTFYFTQKYLRLASSTLTIDNIKSIKVIFISFICFLCYEG